MDNHRQKQTASWLFIALVLSNHGIAMAARIEERGRADKLGWRGQKTEPTASEEDYHKAQEDFSRMSCEELGGALQNAMHQVTGRLTEKCASESCSFSDSESQEIRNLALQAMRLTAIADVADQKMCLPEVIATAGGSLHSRITPFTAKFLDSAVSAEARDRFSLAFGEMTKVQEDIHSLRGEVVDRRLLIPTNIENPAVCPSPCQQCTTEHNSWLKEDEEFSFKCILETGDPKPKGAGLDCADPSPRNGLFHRHQAKTWCKVHDWQNLAVQTLVISAKITCGAKAIFAPIQTGVQMSASLHETCESKESGEAVSQEALDELMELDNTVGDVVSAGNLAIFSVFMAVELTEAVSRLRQDTRSSSLISVGSDGVAQSLDEHSEQQDPHFSYVQGSWKCRRGILSLTRGLFGGMIQIIVGVAYLALMGTFGLLSVMLVFGVDAVLGTLGALAGHPRTDLGATDAISASVTRQVTDQIVHNSIAQEVVATTAATEGALVTATTESVAAWIAVQLAELTVFINSYYWFALAGSVGFAVLFGIWGASKIYRSMRSPYDCSSGFVGRGPHAVCHPAMSFGGGSYEQCPGTSGSENQVSFICSKENQGVATLMNGCHFFDE